MLNISIDTNHTQNIYGNISKQKEFNTYVNKMDTNIEPQWLQNLDSEDYKIPKDILDKTNEGFMQMKEHNISLNDLFYKNDKATIWGKSFGATANKTEAEDLRNFLKLQNVIEIGFVSKEKQDLLNSTDLSIDEFKEKWLELNKQESQTQKTKSDNLSGVVQVVEDKNSFKPIQGESQNNKTYDINKDKKFAYLQELLKLEQAKGIDVLWFMQKLEENSKKVVDKMV